MYIKTGKTESAQPARKPVTRRQRGDTMIEVLVTIIIIAVGVLGAAALQVTTLKNLSSSHSASVAAIVAQDFSERMRANPDAALAGDYTHSEKPAGSAADCVTAPCLTAAALALYDKETWWAQVTAVLPSGSGEVAPIAVGSNIFVLTVRWDEDRSGSTGDTCPKAAETDLECFQLNITI
jgi:type IV pilus assembly protein PilV